MHILVLCTFTLYQETEPELTKFKCLIYNSFTDVKTALMWNKANHALGKKGKNILALFNSLISLPVWSIDAEGI